MKSLVKIRTIFCHFLFSCLLGITVLPAYAATNVESLPLVKEAPENSNKDGDTQRDPLKSPLGGGFVNRVLQDIKIFGDIENITLHADGEGLPGAVKARVDELRAIAMSGDISGLAKILETSPSSFTFSFENAGGDPIEFWKEFSGDEEGREILAILLEILSTGYAIRNPDTKDEIFIWPYLSEIALDKLTPQQIVELFTIITAGEYQDMLDLGSYLFFKVGIDREGNWLFFVPGQ